MDNSILLESHYEVLNSEILPYARNIASESTVDILNTILQKMGIPENCYEIKLTIPTDGFCGQTN